MEYLSKFMRGKEGREGNQESLIEVTTQKSHQIVRNRLLLTSLANLLTFLILIFSMSYYDWGRIEMPFYVLNQKESDLIVRGDLSLFINLLYGKQTTATYYQTYPQLSSQLCLSNDIFCQSVFQELFYLGLLCELLMTVGAVVQAYDIVTTVSYFCEGGRSGEKEEEEGGWEGGDNLRHSVAIGLYLVGITLNVFGLFLMEVEVFLGVSFWVFVGGVLLFIGVVIAQQIALTQVRKQQLMLSLVRG
jgi:hypothetical protein